MGGTASARIGEPYVLKSHGWRQSAGWSSIRALGYSCLRIEKMENRLRGSLCDHPVMHQRSHITERTEDLNTQHQDHDQNGEVHATVNHTECAECQRRSCSNRNTGIRYTAGERVGCQYPHGGFKKIVSLLLQGLSARNALAERLQGCETLNGI